MRMYRINIYRNDAPRFQQSSEAFLKKTLELHQRIGNYQKKRYFLLSLKKLNSLYWTMTFTS